MESSLKLGGTMSTVFKTIDSCGLIAFKGNSMLCIKRNGMWDLPKGKHQEGEQFSQTALRETEEETGLNKLYFDVTRSLAPTIHYSQYDQQLKTTHWFLAKFNGPINHVFYPQFIKGITEVEWISLQAMPKIIPTMRSYAQDVLHNTFQILKAEQYRLRNNL